MSVCPNCGAKRVERFCARCGSAVAGAPSQYPAQVQAGRRSGWLGVGVMVVLVVVGVVSLFYGSMRPSPQPRPQMPPPVTVDASASKVDASTSSYVQQLADQAAQAIDWRQTRLNALATRRAVLDADRMQWRASGNAAENLLQSLQQAYLRAEDTGRWPIYVDGRRLGQLEAESALQKVRIYLAAADWALRDLDSAIDLIDRGALAAQSQTTELRTLRQLLPNPSHVDSSLGPSLRQTGARIASVTARRDEVPDPKQLGGLRSKFESLDLGTLGRPR